MDHARYGQDGRRKRHELALSDCLFVTQPPAHAYKHARRKAFLSLLSLPLHTFVHYLFYALCLFNCLSSYISTLLLYSLMRYIAATANKKNHT